MSILHLFLCLLAFGLSSAASVDKFALRELHVLFQKSDINRDHQLDKKELDSFVERFTKRVPNVFKGVRANKDTIEGAKVLADELFKRHDRHGSGRLSYRGSLVRKSDATQFGEEMQKVLINLVHEINGKPVPYPEVNPFANDGRRRKRNTSDRSEPRIQKHGVATIHALPRPLVKVNSQM